MRKEILDIICCPECHGVLLLRETEWADDEIKSGKLECAACGNLYPVRNFIPRFVSSDDYADAFTVEWTVFRTAQLDSQTGLKESDSTFLQFFNFPVGQLSGQRLLDAGCGKGRFAEIALNYGAEVVCVDLSYAIDAARQNLGSRPNIHFIQADIFNLPLRPEFFDGIYSHGVLHHTPNPPKAFQSLVPLLKAGGFFSIMVYASYNKAYIQTTTFYRKLTTRLPKRFLLILCYLAVPLYYVNKLPVLGPFITRILFPVSVNFPTHQWRICNTFDLYSPKYVFFYDHVEIFNWFKQDGFVNIEPIHPGAGISYIGLKAT